MEKRAEEVTSKTTGLDRQDRLSTQSIIDAYQCHGSLYFDFPELCALLGMKEIPAVTTRGYMETTWCPKAPLQVQLESESDGPFNVKAVRVFGWKVDELMARVFNKVLPSNSSLQHLNLCWAGLTHQTLTSLKNTVSMCSNLRSVVLEGNPFPEHSYHMLISEDSLLTNVSLRNNRIGEKGACLIGSALSTAHSANKNLVSLDLADNSIGDVGAAHIAQGLRLNRSLLCLSLANNDIGDAGAVCLAKVLGRFALTHEEIVEKRMLLLKRDQSERPPMAEERPPPKVAEIVSPLLEPEVQHTGGQVILPVNTALTSLNLAGNRLTEQSLLFLMSSVGAQSKGGLRVLRLNVLGRFALTHEEIVEKRMLLLKRDQSPKKDEKPKAIQAPVKKEELK